MIHKSTFLKEVREIYPEGDLDKSYNLLISILEDEQYTSDGAACDYDFIMKKFRGYHKSWSLKYGKKFERGYLDKKAKIQDTLYTIFFRKPFTNVILKLPSNHLKEINIFLVII